MTPPEILPSPTGKTLKIGVIGPHGRMGQEILKKIEASADLCLGATLSKPPKTMATPLHTEDRIFFCQQSDVLVDFSAPEATLSLLETAIDQKKPLVIGTTGLTESQLHTLKKAGDKIPLLYSPNMSLGITLLTLWIEQAASLLPDSFDIEVTERHHRDKKDAPSGTAWLLAQAAAQGRGVDLKEKAVLGYGSSHKGPRPSGAIGFSIQRGGHVPGDHAVEFLGNHEILSFTHRALDRGIFAEGALQAARWIVHQPAGFYSLKDIYLKEQRS